MAAEITCPRCHNLFSSEQDTTPTHCPHCRQRIACPHCRAILTANTGDTSVFHCTVCHVDLAGLETRTVGEPLTDAGVRTVLVPLSDFELHGRLGRGGMGVVYRAWQKSMKRFVALKFLPPELAEHPTLLERFRREARVGGGMLDPHLLPIFQIVESSDTAAIVMPVVEGCDLGRVVRHRRKLHDGEQPDDPPIHPWAELPDGEYLGRVLPLLDQVVDAVASLHRASVLHRDIKPSNVLVDDKGHAWLSDYGLARGEGHGMVTGRGHGVGTLAYAAPEQARGDETMDARADLFALGATLYQALTLRLPYGKEGAGASSSPPDPPSKVQSLLPTSLDAVITRALAIDPAGRFASADEMRSAWRQARQSIEPPVARRPEVSKSGPPKSRALVAALGAAAVLFGLGLWYIPPRDRDRMPAGGAPAARPPRTAQATPPSAPEPPPAQTRRVMVESTPPGARVALVPLHPQDGHPMSEAARRPAQRTPVVIDDVKAGNYLVAVDLEKYGFHEVYRVVPRVSQAQEGRPQNSWEVMPGGEVRLPIITIYKTREVEHGMVRVPGGRFKMGSPRLKDAPVHEWSVEDFLMDPTEVTVGEFRQVAGDKELPPELRNPVPPADRPMTWVTYNLAAWYAEEVGKRLPEEEEYEFSATNGGTTLYPWGDKPAVTWTQGPPRDAWPIAKVGEPSWDRTKTTPSILGLYSSVAEWTATWHHQYPGWENGFPGAPPELIAGYYAPELQQYFHAARIVRGAPTWVIQHADGTLQGLSDDLRELDPRFRPAYTREQRHPGLGFRCARSAHVRFLDAR